MVSNTGVADVYCAHYGPHRHPAWRYRGIKEEIIPILFKMMGGDRCCQFQCQYNSLQFDEEMCGCVISDVKFIPPLTCTAELLHKPSQPMYPSLSQTLSDFTVILVSGDVGCLSA